MKVKVIKFVSQRRVTILREMGTDRNGSGGIESTIRVLIFSDGAKKTGTRVTSRTGWVKFGVRATRPAQQEWDKEGLHHVVSVV